MSFTETIIRRPVLAIVLSLLITLFGALGFMRLGVREYPAVDPPTISVTTTYPGAAAEVVEAQITEPLEEAINSVAGIRTLTSTSREGTSQIVAEFTLDTPLDTAASDVRDQISRAQRNLPPDANPPVLNKSNADSNPLLGIALRSNKRTPLELSAYAETLKERLQTVPGVASVDQPSEKRYAMRLWLDPEKLAAYNLTPLDVRAALNRENIELPSGRIEGETIELPVKTLSRLNSAEEFNKLILKRAEDRIVRFRDVGYAELGALNERSSLRVGETPVAGLYFKPQPGANQIDIADELTRRLAQIRREVPADIQIDVAYDNTAYVRRSLHEVEETIVIAFGLVVLVVFAFFREWRTTLIPVIAIPVSIVGAFAIMHAAGFSINTLTLLGIVLAIGLVVDDAIVVLENIYAKIETGVPPLQAGIEGTKEIFVAVIATTITLAVVFLPLLFMGGLSGRLFREFGVTIAGAVLISAFVALTLTPMLSARLLKRHETHGWLFTKTEPMFRWIDATYARGLGVFLRQRWLGLVALVGACAVSWLCLRQIPRELSPLEDRGRLWVRANAAEGVSYDYMYNTMDDVAKVVAERVPEAEIMMTQVPGSGGGQGAQGAVNSGFVRVFLKDKSARGRSQQEIAEDLLGAVRGLTSARISITQEPSIGERRGGAGQGVSFVIQAPSLDALREVLPGFLEAARARPEFSFVDSDLKFNKPEVRVTINRDKAQALGVGADEIARTLQAALSGQRLGYFILNGKQYEIVGQLTRDFRSRPKDLGNLSVRAAGTLPLQPLRVGHDHGQPDARAHGGRRRGGDAGAGEGAARRPVHDGAERGVAGFRRELGVAGLGLRARARLDLSRARGAVRKLPRPVRDFAHGAAGAGRRARGVVVVWPDAEYFLADRSDHARGTGDEERNIDCRVCESAETRRRARAVAGGHRGGGGAVAAHLDDDTGDHSRDLADRPRVGGRSGEPRVDGHRRHRRIGGRRSADAVRDPGDLRDGECAGSDGGERGPGGEGRAGRGAGRDGDSGVERGVCGEVERGMKTQIG